jgi:transketolase C-terminal domain/subunit
LYSFPTIQPLDTEILNTILKTHHAIYTIEEHRVSGGFGSSIVEYINSIQIKNTIHVEKIGLNDSYTTISAEYDRLLEFHKLTPELIAERISKLIH